MHNKYRYINFTHPSVHMGPYDIRITLRSLLFWRWHYKNCCCYKLEFITLLCIRVAVQSCLDHRIYHHSEFNGQVRKVLVRPLWLVTNKFQEVSTNFKTKPLLYHCRRKQIICFWPFVLSAPLVKLTCVLRLFMKSFDVHFKG